MAASCDSLKEHERLKVLFSSFFEEADINKDGFVSIHELRDILSKKYDKHMSNKEIVNMFNDFDKDGDQKISKSEFLSSLLKPARREAYKQTFQSMDTDGTGKLSISQIGELCDKAGMHQDKTALEDIFSKADLDGNGQIDFDEFMALV